MNQNSALIRQKSPYSAQSVEQIMRKMIVQSNVKYATNLDMMHCRARKNNHPHQTPQEGQDLEKNSTHLTHLKQKPQQKTHVQGVKTIHAHASRVDIVEAEVITKTYVLYANTATNTDMYLTIVHKSKI